MRSGGTRLVRAAALVAATVAPCAGFAACGLDENGILGDASSVDVAIGDVAVLDVAADAPPDVVVDNYVPPTCANLDASCLGVPIPSGWIPIGLVANAATPCPGTTTDFQQGDWVTNPKLHSGACQCGACTTSGAYTCTGQVSVGTGNNGCSTSNEVFDAGPHCTTSVTSGGNSQIAGSLPTVGGSVTCSAGVISTQVDTTPVRTCKPLQCTTDYCGLAGKGFSLCILYNGAASCPSGFAPGLPTNNSTPGKLDVQQNATASCSPCTCTVDNPGTSCSAELRAFSSNNCDGDGGTNGPGFMDAYAAQGSTTCLPVNSPSLASVFYLPTPPAPGCANTSTGSGTASLKAPVTVCCAP